MAFDIAEEQVAHTEAALGRKLPHLYRQTMMGNNGGTAFTEEDQWELYPLKDASDKKRLSRSCNDVLGETKLAQQWNGFPSEALAIGSNGMGDVMILLPSSSDPSRFEDRIFVYLHETGEVKLSAEDLCVFEIE